MFVGRENEKNLILEKATESKFELGLIYGRRRIGKTTLLKNVLKEKNGIYFVATEMDFQYNLEVLSNLVADYFKESISFTSLDMIFSYLKNKSLSKRIIIVIDEFTYLTSKEKGVESLFQNIIDHIIKDSNILLILSGSQVGMIEDVISYRRPLFGRFTFKIKLEEFNYYESSLFFTNFTNIDKIRAYSVFGGIPYYLEKINDKLTLKENIIKLIIGKNADFKDEIEFFLKQELRSINAYGMVLNTIANGATKLNEITQQAQIKESGTASNYINTLRNLNIIEKEICFGENENSKKTIYRIKDNFFNFCYFFIQKNKSKIALLDDDYFYDNFVEPMLDKYVSKIFEVVAKQFLIRKNKLKEIEVFYEINRFWGNNPLLKREVEIDLVTKNDVNLTVYECKWTSDVIRESELNNLQEVSTILKPSKYGAFSKSGFSSKAKKMFDESYSIDDLF